MSYSLCMMADFDFAKARPFGWAIAFARWAIFKIISFFEYLRFFRAVFLKEQF